MHSPADHRDPRDDRPRRSARTVQWWTLNPIGSVIGFVFAALSVTPSLLPRPTILQGVLAALASASGTCSAA